MTPRIPEEFSTSLIDWSSFVITGNTMPPRDHPDEDDEDEEEEGPRRRTAGRARAGRRLEHDSPRKSRQGCPRRLAVALRLRGGLLRRAVSNVAVPALPWDARP